MLYSFWFCLCHTGIQYMQCIIEIIASYSDNMVSELMVSFLKVDKVFNLELSK